MTSLVWRQPSPRGCVTPRFEAAATVIMTEPASNPHCSTRRKALSSLDFGLGMPKPEEEKEKPEIEITSTFFAWEGED